MGDKDEKRKTPPADIKTKEEAAAVVGAEEVSPSSSPILNDLISSCSSPVANNNQDQLKTESQFSLSLDQDYFRGLDDGSKQSPIDPKQLLEMDISELDDNHLTSLGCRQCVESRGDCFYNKSERKLTTKTKYGLVYTNREHCKLRDFNTEVRATMDVEQFVYQAEMILDMQEVCVEDIVEKMLHRALENEHDPDLRLKEAKEVIFVNGSSMLMATTIQGTKALVEVSKDGREQTSALEYDQSWLCALCKLPTQIYRRHMVIARFKQPINMGDKAHEVSLFMLIITPVKDKDTKNALETGRNFATMLTDTIFRKRLLAAKSETEFRSLMMVKAQQLANVKNLKNRHKYILDAAVHLSMTSLNFSNDDCSQGVPCPIRQREHELKIIKLAKTTPEPISESTNDLNNNNNNNTSNSSHRLQSPIFNKHPRQSKLIEFVNKSTEEDAIVELTKRKELESKFNETINYSSSALRSYSLFKLEFGKGLWGDFKRRIVKYPSDFSDAFVGPPKTLQKTIATIWFLYFGILLPTIAFSSLNTTQTQGHLGDLRKAIIGQAIGGLAFAYFGGQPLVIIMTTAPLCLYTKIIHQMCIDYGYDFLAMYAAVGLWNGVFLTIYSLFGFSKLMKWCTRSIEEIFALFIVIAFITDASKDLIKNFNKYYNTPACENPGAALSMDPNSICKKETSLLFILLMLGTLWMATSLYKFRKTPYLEAGKRELLADYALPVAVIVMSFFGSYVFDDIYVEKFPPLTEITFTRAQVELLPWSGYLISLGLGFTLSLLFFMDQNISAAMVDAPQNKLKKGCAYHFDLLVVGILNGFLTIYGLPMMHGVLPHSPLHVRSLADIEERVEEGHLREVLLANKITSSIVNVRETRVTGICSHFLILASLLLIPYPIAYIPTAVLNGLFLYMAVTSLDGLQLFERILLLFTEQSKYPPNHYIRRCPQRKIHQFTILQLFQLLIMCFFGFSPINIIEMFFPVIILLMIPFRHKVVTKYIDEKYLDALDGKH